MRKNSIYIRRRLALLAVAAVMIISISGCGSRSKESLKNEQAYRQMGIAKMDEGDYAAAVELFQKALDQSMAIIDELEIDICFYKATAQYKSGDVEGALETCDALLEYDKKNAQGYYLRGSIYLQQNTDKALSDFKSALKYDEENSGMYTNVAENLQNAGMKDEADEILQQALKLPGETAGDYRNKGVAYYLLEEYDSARQYLDKAAGLEDDTAILYLAKVYESQGKQDQAQQFYETYAAQNAGDTETLNTLGCLKMSQGDYPGALKFFQTALSAENPANKQELQKNEIAALEFSLDFAGAKEKMEAYLAEYPDDEAAKREYEFLKSRQPAENAEQPAENAEQ